MGWVHSGRGVHIRQGSHKTWSVGEPNAQTQSTCALIITCSCYFIWQWEAMTPFLFSSSNTSSILFTSASTYRWVKHFFCNPGFSKFMSMLLVSLIQWGPKCFFGLVRGSNLQVCVYVIRYKPAKGFVCVNGHQVHSLSIEDFKMRIDWLMTFYEDPLSWIRDKCFNVMESWSCTHDT